MDRVVIAPWPPLGFIGEAAVLIGGGVADVPNIDR
jgi:hypothetical protein